MLANVCWVFIYEEYGGSVCLLASESCVFFSKEVFSCGANIDSIAGRGGDLISDGGGGGD